MRYSGQKFFILLGLFLIPILFVGALLREPVVNRGLLRITLSLLKTRLGASLKAQTWKVDLSKFAVAVEGVEFKHEKLFVTARELRAEFSPLFLLIGRIHLSRVWANEVEVFGEVKLPPRPKDDKPFNLDRSINEAGDALVKIQKQMDENKIGFDLVELSQFRIDTNLVSVGNGDLKIENFGYGHVKTEFAVEKITGESKYRSKHKDEVNIPELERLQASVVLYKDRTNSYLSVRNLNLELQNKDFLHTTLEIKGRLPGDASIDFISDLGELKKWMKVQAPTKLNKFAKEHNFGGYIELRGLGEFGGGGVRHGEVNLRGRNLIWSDMGLAKIESTVEVRDKEWKVASVKGKFNGTRLDKNLKNEFSGKDLIFENDKIAGNLQVTNLGLCALLRGVGVPDCQVDLSMNGTVVLGGTLKPLKILPVVSVYTEPFQVFTDADFVDVPASGRLLGTKPGHVTGRVEINDTKVEILEARGKFTDSAVVTGTGTINISPIRVYLKISAEKAKVDDILRDFLGLPVKGLAKAEVTVDYDERRPKEFGRTDFFADYLIRGLDVADFPIGDATGKLTYLKKIVEFKPTIRMGPGTLNVAGQIGKLDPSIEGSQMSIYANAVDYEILVPKKQGPPVFDGVANFEAHLSGALGDNSSRPFGGKIKAALHSLTSFGIPFERGEISGYVDLTGLKIDKLTAYKGDVKTELSGFLGPKNSRVEFACDYVPIKYIGFEPDFERLAQTGELKAGGFWDQNKGWAIDGQTRNLKIGPTSFPTVSLRFEGDKDDSFFANVEAGEDIKFRYDSKDNSFRGKLKDAGIFLALTFINKWERVPEFLRVKGDLDISWSDTLGQIDLNELDIQVTDRWSQDDRQLIKLDKTSRIVYQNGVFRGGADFSSGLGNFKLAGEGGELAGKGKLSVRLLDLFLPDFLRLVEGGIGVDLNWNPKLADSLRAQAVVENATAYMPVLGAELRGVKGNIRYAKGRVFFDSINGRSGDVGDFSLGGDMAADASEMNLKTHLSSVSMRMGRDVELVISGDLDLAGKQKPFLLKGKARVEKGLLRKEFSGSGIKTAILAKPFVDFDVPFEVLSGFQVRNSLADAFVTGRGRLLGNDLSPIIAGRFDVVKGNLLAKDNEFAISFARVQMPEDPSFDPVNINVQASVLKSYQGIDYRIFLSAEGNPDDLRLIFRSEPGLSQRELISLLTLGYVPQEQPIGSQGSTMWDPLESTCRHASLSIL